MEGFPKRIGLISDTHGRLGEEAMEALAGSELIIHAGDIGGRRIIDSLQRIAPVIAVRGNTDRDCWSASLPEATVVDAGSVLIYVLHDIHALDLDPAAAGFRIVVSGHSHKPSRSEQRGILYLNPGSAGPRRFQLPVTLARLDVHREPWKIDFVNLSRVAGKGETAESSAIESHFPFRD